MIKKTLFVFLLIFTSLSTNAGQQYSKTFANFGAVLNDVYPTMDGGFIILGSNVGKVLIKLDEDLNVTWSTEFDNVSNVTFKKVTETSKGDFFVIGTAWFNGTGELFTAKINASGVIVNAKTYYHSSTNSIWDIVKDGDGGALVVGGGCAGSNYVIQLDKNLNITRQKGYNLTQDGTATCIRKNSKGNYIVGGNTHKSGMRSFQIFEIDSNGNLLWAKTYPVAAEFFTKNITVLKNGGYVAVGYTKYMNPSGGSDIFVVKTDSNGNVIWTNIIDHDWEIGYDVVELSDESLLVGGNSTFFGNDNDLTVTKISSAGEIMFIKASRDVVYSSIIERLIPICDNKIAAFGATGLGISYLDQDGNGFCTDSIIPTNQYTVIKPTLVEGGLTSLTLPLSFGTSSFTLTQKYFRATELVHCNTTKNEDPCKIVSNSIRINNNFKIYPNPADEILQVELNDYYSVVEIVNTMGQIMMSKTGSGLIQFDISSLASGLYTVLINKVDTNSVIAHKIIIE